MAHEKVFGICENKCKVEVVPKATYESKVEELSTTKLNKSDVMVVDGKILNVPLNESREVLLSITGLEPNSNWFPIFVGQDQAEREKGSSDYITDFSGIYKPMVSSSLSGYDNDQVVSFATPEINSKLQADSDGKMLVSVYIYGCGVSFDLELVEDVKFKIVFMKK